MRTDRGDFVAVTPELLRVMRLVDGLSPRKAAARLAEDLGSPVGEHDVERLVDTYLRPNGLLAGVREEGPPPPLSFRRRWKVLDAEAANRAARLLTWLYHPVAVVAALAGFVATASLLLVGGLATPPPRPTTAAARGPSG
jgi:hypothetical protein